jgi:putative ABC transport system permease protein
MKIRDLLPLSFKALLVNKSRTILTMLGIVIGIGSVILMISVGEAAQRYLLSQVASFGSDLVTIGNGRGDENENGPPSSAQKQTLTMRDYDKLKSLSWVQGVDASFLQSDIVGYGGAEKRTSISGATPDELVVYSASIERGIFFSDDDVAARRRVAVLGKKVADKLFGQEDPIGRTVKIGKQPFRVIGIQAPAGTRYFSDADDQVIVPVTAALDLYGKDKLNFLSIKTGNVRPTEAKELIRVALRETHNINNPEGKLSKDDFQVTSQEDAIKSADTIGSILQILLGSIASISLVVAGVGIMNIMYVTVTERTREIGLRKAIGAKSFDILGQFLAEAIMLTVVAGAIGIIFGISLAWIAIQIISQFQDGWTFGIPWDGAMIGFTVSVVVGVVFGYFPARTAAKLRPIEALRHE